MAFEIGLFSVVAIVSLIYLGVYIPIALGLVSLVAIWLMRDNFELALNLLKIAVGDSVTNYAFATVPLFTFMGLLVSKAGLGSDVYIVMNAVFRRIRGGLGIATVGANAVFAAVTGSSIASASVFTKVAVPEMLRFGYTPRFAVGVVAGSSVLGMIIPPSAMLIIYAIVAEVSVGHMFLAGVVPGILLAIAYCGAILFMGAFTPKFVGGPDLASAAPAPRSMGAAAVSERSAAAAPVPGSDQQDQPEVSLLDGLLLLGPIVFLISIVLGGIYTGWLTPVEAGATGSAFALLIALARRRMTLNAFWSALLETGHITAAILFLITAASMYSRMLGFAGLPSALADMLQTYDLGFVGLMVLYVALMLFLGTLLDTASIILIVVPLFLPVVEPMGMNLVWFGIITVIGAEIGLLTPPLGISCFVIKSTVDDPSITLKDVFLGALPFAFVMLLVLVLIIRYPALSIGILG